MENERFDLQNFPTSESAKRMIGMVTAGFYDMSYVGKWIYQVMGLEYDKARELIESMAEQMFPETATWGLMYHEIKWGLPVRDYLSYEERRALIYEKRDIRAPMTPYRMEQYLDAVTDFDVCVVDVHDPGEFGYVPPHPNVFHVYCVGDGILDTKSLRRILDRVKQSHTTYILTDLVRWELDHRKMEYLDLVDVNIHTDMPFWGCVLLDGSLLLDGSEYLNARRRYDLRLGIILAPLAMQFFEDLHLSAVAVTLGLPITEYIVAAQTIPLGRLDFWKTCYLDGSAELDGSQTLNQYIYNMVAGLTVNAKMGLNESLTGGSVVTTRNLAYFDGSERLDGSRMLNSIYKKEVI